MIGWVRSSQTSPRRGRGECLFGRRLMSRSDVKQAQPAGRSQNRQMMRGGRT